MEFPKIQEILQPPEFEQDEIAEMVVYDKMIEIYVRIMLVCGVLLMVAVIF